MKASSIAVAVTLVLAFVCILQSSAVPYPGVQKPDEAGGNDTPVETLMEPRMSAGLVRQKRQSHLSMCRYCCNCCRGNNGCGYCCMF